MRHWVAKKWAAFSGLLALVLLTGGCVTSGQLPDAEPLVAIDLMEGPSVPMAKLLDESVAVALSTRGLRARTGSISDPDFRLKGTAMASRGAPGGRVAVIRWLLTDPAGQLVGSHVHDVVGRWERWESGQPDIIAQVARKAADPIAQLVPRPGSQTIVMKDGEVQPSLAMTSSEIEPEAEAPQVAEDAEDAQETPPPSNLPSTPVPTKPVAVEAAAPELDSSETDSAEPGTTDAAAPRALGGERPNSEILARASEPLVPNPSVRTDLVNRPVLEPRPPRPQSVDASQPTGPTVPDIAAPDASVYLDSIAAADPAAGEALRRALGVALRLEDLTVTRDRAGATARVVGKIDLEAPVSGLVPVQVSWEAFGLNGSFLGRITQQNRVPEGTLPRGWASVAAAIATNAAPALRKLVIGETVMAAPET